MEVNKGIGALKPLRALKPMKILRQGAGKGPAKPKPTPVSSITHSTAGATPRTGTQHTFTQNNQASQHTKVSTTGRPDNAFWNARRTDTTTSTTNVPGQKPQQSSNTMVRPGHLTRTGQTAVVGGAGALAGVGATNALHKRRQPMAKSLEMGIMTPVAKSSPDQADLHVAGTLRPAKKVRRKAS